LYASVFLVVAALELYGTALGTWRWAGELPGLGVPDGNPPSGVASGYVWFDVMALLTAPVVIQVMLPRLRRAKSKLAKDAGSGIVGLFPRLRTPDSAACSRRR